MSPETLRPEDQIIEWGFGVWPASLAIFPERFMAVIGGMEFLPPDFANVGWVLEGKAITDKGLGVLYSPFFGAGPDEFIALDGQLLTYILAYWTAQLADRFDHFKNTAVIAPSPAIAMGIAYGNDMYGEIFNSVMSAIDDAISRARGVGVPSLVEPGYGPAYVVLPAAALIDLARIFVDTEVFVDHIRASLLSGTPVGVVDTFAQEAEFSGSKVKKTSSLGFAAMAFAGIGVAVIFAGVMTVKGRKK